MMTKQNWQTFSGISLLGLALLALTRLLCEVVFLLAQPLDQLMSVFDK